MSTGWLGEFCGLGLLSEPEENQFTDADGVCHSKFMSSQAHRMEYEFAKCINQMARSNGKSLRRIDGAQTMSKSYKVAIKIGHGHTYSKYNTLMHFLNVMECYWHNPDLNNIQVFGKDIRRLLAISCQKIFFQEDSKRGFYHYGVFEPETRGSYFRNADMDLAVASNVGYINPSVSRSESRQNVLVITDRVYEFHYLRNLLAGMFDRAGGAKVKSDNIVLNLCLLSLMLDFGLYEMYGGLLNLPYMQSLARLDDKRQLQVEILT